MYHLSSLFTVQDGLELDHYYPFISGADGVTGPLLTDESKFVVKTTSYSYTTISDSAEGGENISNYVQLTGHLSIWSGSALNENKVRSFTLFFSASNTCINLICFFQNFIFSTDFQLRHCCFLMD
jgi:hypothetical protein